MTISRDFRPTFTRAKAIGRALLEVYDKDEAAIPPELLELLDMAQARLARAGYSVDGAAPVGSTVKASQVP
jgi:hypothetical protein